MPILPCPLALRYELAVVVWGPNGPHGISMPGVRAWRQTSGRRYMTPPRALALGFTISHAPASALAASARVWGALDALFASGTDCATASIASSSDCATSSRVATANLPHPVASLVPAPSSNGTGGR